MAKVKRQMKVPGTEGKSIRECDAAAEAYVSARDDRMQHTEKEVEARDALVSVMKKHQLTVYRDDEAEPPLIVTLTPGVDKVKVTRADGEEDAAEPPRRRRKINSAAEQRLPAGDRE